MTNKYGLFKKYKSNACSNSDCFIAKVPQNGFYVIIRNSKIILNSK